MRTIQEVFNLVIGKEYFKDAKYFMCIAADKALKDGVITQEEYTLIENAITEYLGNEIFLMHVIINKIEAPPHRLTIKEIQQIATEIYSSWDDRDHILEIVKSNFNEINNID